jgi:hypothetical protein
MAESKIKTVLICFIDISCVIHFEIIFQGAIVNQAFCLEVLKRLIDAMRHK